MADFTGNGQSFDFPVRGSESFSIQITGTFVGTVTFRSSVDNVNFVDIALSSVGGGAAVTSSTAPGIFSGSSKGLSLLRCIVTAFTSGTITAVLRTGKGA